MRLADRYHPHVEIEDQPLERLTWLVHPNGRVRCLLRAEWKGDQA